MIGVIAGLVSLICCARLGIEVVSMEQAAIIEDRPELAKRWRIAGNALAFLLVANASALVFTVLKAIWPHL